MNRAGIQKKSLWRISSALFLFIYSVSLFLFATPVSAALPVSIISYQGRLLNSNRAPVSDTSASMIFQFYTASSGGTCLWSNSSATCASATARTVTLTDGLFSENLGDTAASPAYAAISDSVFGENASVYLQITIGGETLSPRKQIVSAPFAINALLLNGFATEDNGSTAAGIVALNSSGNVVFTGNPASSGIDAGSVYINPATADLAANDTIFGIANGGSARFRVDAEGDTVAAGSLSSTTGVFSSTTSSVNLFDDTSGTTTIDIGGVDSDRGNTINIATNSTSADTITLGNTHASTGVAINSGTAWSVTTAGAATFNGSLSAGDTTGTDAFTFTSAATTTTAFSLNTNSLTSGKGFQIMRTDSIATDFTGTLVDIQQGRTSGGSTGKALNVSNSGGGDSTAVYITQNQVANATTTATAQALVIDVNENANNDEVILIRSDADNSGGVRDTEFRFENDGDAFADGAWNAAGADYAEYFPASEHIAGYTIVCWDEEQSYAVESCTAGDTNVLGVVSTNPGFIGNGYSGAEASLENDPNYALVGLVGQIETFVSTDAGSIAIGDAITTSSVRAGYGAKAPGGTYIIGRALEPLASGAGTIKVLVQPMWYGGEMLTSTGEATAFTNGIALGGADATATHQLLDSAGLAFVGSAWNGSFAQDVSLSLRNVVEGTDASHLSLTNNDNVDVMTFGSTGDLAIAGNFYPSDRGVLQYGAYVYYDSTGAGYMRTNAAGWSSNASNYSESFASADALVPGDVVEFAADGSGVVRSSGETYSARIAGVVASQSGFIAGSALGEYPVAVSGRVSLKVSDENGAIESGDALTTSSRAGFAMKATEPGQIIGYALASWSFGEGSIAAFVRPQYQGTSGASNTSSIAINSQDIETLNITNLLSMNGGNIINVGTLSGIGTWQIKENGDIVTDGQLTQVVHSLQNTSVSTYPTTSPETMVQLSGTSTLHNGMARVSFENVSPEYNDIISPESSYRVLVTPNGLTGQLYVTDRSNAGFIIRDANGSEGVSVDWLVLAYRHDMVPVESSTIDDATPVLDMNEDVENDVNEDASVGAYSIPAPVTDDASEDANADEDVETPFIASPDEDMAEIDENDNASVGADSISAPVTDDASNNDVVQDENVDTNPI